MRLDHKRRPKVNFVTRRKLFRNGSSGFSLSNWWNWLRSSAAQREMASLSTPCQGFLSGSMSDCAEKGFVRNAMYPEASAASNPRVLISGHVNNRTEIPSALRPCLSSIPDPSFRLMSRMTQVAFSKSVWLLKACADRKHRFNSFPHGSKRLLPQHSGGVVATKTSSELRHHL